MSHYICKGNCGGHLEEIGICETDGCSEQWSMMEDCHCTDGLHGTEIEDAPVKDAHGNVLQTGDSVTLIKDLKLKGSSQVLKVGTKASNIRLTNNLEEIDCKINGTAIVLRVEFLKKL